jgi:L-2-hydroxyglutarate oxidase LhgO
VVDVDVVVIGAGVVGLACAAALAPRHDVLVIERHRRAGTETSSRNSGVIHAGLYYPPGSRKARACVEGRRRLYAYAAARGVPHRRTGKLVLAVEPSEIPSLQAIEERARRNGAEELTWLDREALAAREPELRAALALHVGESGIVDAHALMDALKVDARDAGARFVFGHEVVALEPSAHDVRVVARDHRGEESVVRARVVVNAAGHGTDRVASVCGVDLDARGWRQHPWVGRYFGLHASAPRPTTPLVYPMPAVGGLGVHLTRDLGGQTLAGPDAAPLEVLADGSWPPLDVAPALRDAFAQGVARYLPRLRAEHLTPAYAGVRPKLHADGSFADFVIEETPRGVIHLLGIESPGLTASLALADEVSVLVAQT